jgi:transposase
VARQRQNTEAFQQRHAARAGIEGTLWQGVRAFSLRRTRYIGLVKTHLGHIATAAAMNLARVVTWLTERPRETARLSRFARMVQAV